MSRRRVRAPSQTLGVGTLGLLRERGRADGGLLCQARRSLEVATFVGDVRTQHSHRRRQRARRSAGRDGGVGPAQRAVEVWGIECQQAFARHGLGAQLRRIELRRGEQSVDTHLRCRWLPEAGVDHGQVQQRRAGEIEILDRISQSQGPGVHRQGLLVVALVQCARSVLAQHHGRLMRSVVRVRRLGAAGRGCQHEKASDGTLPPARTTAGAAHARPLHPGCRWAAAVRAARAAGCSVAMPV